MVCVCATGVGWVGVGVGVVGAGRGGIHGTRVGLRAATASLCRFEWFALVYVLIKFYIFLLCPIPPPPILPFSLIILAPCVPNHPIDAPI